VLAGCDFDQAANEMGVPQAGAFSLVIGPPYAPTRLRFSMQSHDVDFVSIVEGLIARRLLRALNGFAVNSRSGKTTLSIRLHLTDTRRTLSETAQSARICVSAGLTPFMRLERFGYGSIASDFRDSKRLSVLSKSE
jgi:hypothetical protein